jgi:hypothetical protein
MRRAFLLALLLLTSCATAAQRQFEAISSGNTAINVQLNACIQAVYDEPASAPIRAHLSTFASDLTLQQLADQSLATPSEVAAILAQHPKLAACRKTALNGLIGTMPGLVPILTRTLPATMIT